MSSLETPEFYNLRGQSALVKTDFSFGSQSIPQHLRAPYEFAESLLPTPMKGARFLDFCCGTGIHSIYPAQIGYEVTGIDLSEKSILAAQKLSQHFGVSQRTKFLVTDALSYLQNCENFDVIFTSGSLYYFDPEFIMPILLKKLKPGGHMICVETYGDNKILNLLRPLLHRKGTRDTRTLNHLLRAKDIDGLKKYFGTTEVIYFDFLTLSGLGLNFLRTLDRILLNQLGMRFLSFKFVFHGVKSLN